MENAALVLWLLTAAGGLTMAAIWLLRGGLRQRDEVLELSYADVSRATDVTEGTPPSRRSRLPAWMITTHGAVAALGLLLWIFYVGFDGTEGTGVSALPPFVVTLLLVVATLGVLMVRRWREHRQELVAAEVPKADRPPEQRFPALVVALHGLLAVATLVLVLLVAFGVGD
jgi:hypothetical protein